MITPETMLIVAGAAFLLFGGKKLPELGRSLGAGIREFRSGTQGLKDELENDVPHQTGQPVSPAAQTPVPDAVQVGLPSATMRPSPPVTRTIELGKPVPAHENGTGRPTE